jgi:hypothetical protein
MECKQKVSGSVFEMPTKCTGGDPLPWDLTSSKPSTPQAHVSRTSQNFNNTIAFRYGLVYCTLPRPVRQPGSPQFIFNKATAMLKFITVIQHSALISPSFITLLNVVVWMPRGINL